MKANRGLAVIVASLSVLLIACSGGDEGGGDTNPSEGVEGKAGLCANLQLLGKTLDKLQNFAPSTTLSEAQDARNDVNFSLSELSQAASEVSTRQVAKAVDSFTSFNAELDAMASGTASGSQPIGDAAATLKARAIGLSEVQTALGLEAACPQ